MKFAQGEKIVLVGGLLLAADLFALPWHRFGVPGGAVQRTAIESPNGGYGIFTLLLIAVVVLQIIGSRTGAQMPQPAIGWNKVHQYLGVLILVVVIMKLFALTEALSIGALLGVVLAGAVAYGGYLIGKEPGYP